MNLLKKQIDNDSNSEKIIYIYDKLLKFIFENLNYEKEKLFKNKNREIDILKNKIYLDEINIKNDLLTEISELEEKLINKINFEKDPEILELKNKIEELEMDSKHMIQKFDFEKKDNM